MRSSSEPEQAGASQSTLLEVARIGDSEPRSSSTFVGSTEAYLRDDLGNQAGEAAEPPFPDLQDTADEIDG